MDEVKVPVGRPYGEVIIGVPTEVFPGEKRVAATPQSVKTLTKAGFKFVVEGGAGIQAKFRDEDFVAAGASIVTREELYKTADIVAKIRPPTADEKLKPGATLFSMIRVTKDSFNFVILHILIAFFVLV